MRSTAPETAPEGWYDDNDIALLVGKGAARPAIWDIRYDEFFPSEFYRGYLSVLGWIENAIRRNPTMRSLLECIDDFDVVVKALPADQRREGARFALSNVAEYANAGTIPEIRAALDVEMVCIAHCFVRNRNRGL
jgi:hypothetical protein